jgi:hypothetical protein
MPYANQRKAVVADFGADPNDSVTTGLMGRIWNTLQGKYTAPYRPDDNNPQGGIYTGLHTPVQAFMGSNQLGANPVQYNNGAFPTIDTGLIEGPMGDPARRIFAQRLARRKGTL